MEGLTATDIAKLIGGSRTRDQYGPKLLSFVESDEAAINPVDIWPVEFGEKKTSTLYQGFRNAAKSADLDADLTILQRDGKVFIMHKARVQQVINPVVVDDPEVDTVDES